ncbi:MAG: glycosyltransferase family 2 protein [Burkholderiales bacterium]
MSIEMSVITVCRNSAAVMPRMLETLRSQTWQAREWVVVDGGSTDGTQDLVAGSGERLGDWVSEPDAGIYDAMNKGWRRARGDVLFFLNSDDALFDPGTLAAAAAAFEREPAAELAIGQVVYRFADGRMLLRDYHHLDAESLLFEDLCHQAVFARRSLFERIGGFNERFRINADYDWLIRALRAGAPVAWIDQPVAYFTTGGAHARNFAALVAERHAVRLQYLSSAHLTLGGLWRRAVGRTRRVFRLPAPGQRPFDPVTS